MKFILLISLIFCIKSFARKVETAFSITHELTKTIINTPKTRTDDISVTVTNNTFSDIYAKITTKSKNIKFFRVDSNSQHVVEIHLDKDEEYYYIPIAPSLYPVDIVFGEGQYEIPGKK